MKVQIWVGDILYYAQKTSGGTVYIKSYYPATGEVTTLVDTGVRYDKNSSEERLLLLDGQLYFLDHDYNNARLSSGNMFLPIYDLATETALGWHFVA